MALYGLHMTPTRGTQGASIDGMIVQIEHESLTAAIKEAEELHPGMKVVRGAMVEGDPHTPDLEAWMAARSRR
jgi:hypothetical protein